jgi:hypothetical protein
MGPCVWALRRHIAPLLDQLSEIVVTMSQMVCTFIRLEQKNPRVQFAAGHPLEQKSSSLPKLL